MLLDEKTIKEMVQSYTGRTVKSMAGYSNFASGTESFGHSESQLSDLEYVLVGSLQGTVYTSPTNDELIIGALADKIPVFISGQHEAGYTGLTKIPFFIPFCMVGYVSCAGTSFETHVQFNGVMCRLV